MSRYSFLLLACLITPVFAQNVALKVDTTRSVRDIDPKIYGQFLEHIYHSVNGGVWGEVVWNRSFEERLSPDDWRVRGGVLITPADLNRESRFLIGAETWKDYDFYANLRKTGGDGALLIGVRTSRANGLAVRFDGKQAQLLRNSTDRHTRITTHTTLGTADAPLDKARWSAVRIRCEGPRVQVWLNDRPVFDLKTGPGTDNGQVFVGSQAASGEFGGFRVVATDHTTLFDALPSIARHWKGIGQGELSLDPEQALNSKLSLKITGAAGTGVAQDQFAVRKGDTLRGSMWVRGESPGGISVRLMSGTYVLAQDSLAPPTQNWREYPLSFTPEEDSPNASLEIVTRGASTIWLDQVSLMADSSLASGGFRPDLLKAITALHPPVIRWPGGSFVNNYHWKETIGPQSKRVGKTGWDEVDPLAFGVDEFMSFSRRVGAEPIVVIYAGPRNAKPAERAQYVQDAKDFVEYCNAPASSKWGKLRASNGHPAPYGVKYWEIDNEIWSMKPDDYVEVLRQFIPAMKEVDPTIQTIACGSGDLGAHWAEGDLAVIDHAAELVNYLSIHHYEKPEHFAEGPAADESFWNGLGERISKSKNPNLKLFVSEWNAQSTDWRTGLYAGAILNAFERNGLVAMATPALWLRHVSAPAWDNAFINFDSRGWFPAPNYVVMKLYRDHFAPQLLKVQFDGTGINADASKSADGKRVVIKLVNPSDSLRTVSVDLSGFSIGAASLSLIAPDNLNARNTMDHPDAVHVAAGKVDREGNALKVALPRWSVAVLEVNSAVSRVTESAPPVIARPDVLTLLNGQPVKDPQTWWKERRPEILELLETQEYGRMPSGKLSSKVVPKFRVESVNRAALGGAAIRKQVTISFPSIKNSPKLHLLIYVPSKIVGAVPAFVGLNFNGNHTVDADPGIDLPEIWAPDPANKSARIRMRAQDAQRGSAAQQWQVEKIIARGYGLATIYCGDIEPDFDGGMQFGVRQMFLKSKQTKVGPDEWGAIGAWAWGLSRALDYLQTDSDIDGQKVAVFGFSRLGKAAVWAGGRDQRFAMVISNESGQGGVSLSQRKAGERLDHLNNAFPHWFAANYRKYIGREETLPVDGHLVLSLVAPRPAYVASAELDSGSDPKGEFLSAVEASRVYRLLGKTGLPTAEMPPLNQPVFGDIGYHVRSGKHDVTAYDWDRYLDFADRQFGR